MTNNLMQEHRSPIVYLTEDRVDSATREKFGKAHREYGIDTRIPLCPYKLGQAAVDFRNNTFNVGNIGKYVCYFMLATNQEPDANDCNCCSRFQSGRL